MNLEEFRAELEAHMAPIEPLPEPNKAPQLFEKRVGHHIVVVVDDDGLAQYHVLYPDGHLGAVED